MIGWIIAAYVGGKAMAEPKWVKCGGCGRMININGIMGGIHQCC